MTKTKKGSRQQQKESQGFIAKFNLEEILPQKYHVLAVILVLVILFLAFLSPLFFGGKTFQSGDIISSESMQPYIHHANDGYTLWNPLIFCGMPAYAIGTAAKWFNVIYVIFTAIRSLFADLFVTAYSMWAFYVILLAITSFLLMRYITKNTLVSTFTAIATSFSTGLIVFLFIGHVTKLTAICMYPILFLILLRLQKGFKIIDFLILTIALQLMVQSFHVQIIFYTFFAVAIYLIYYFLRSLIKKDTGLRNNIIKSAVSFFFAALIALLIQSDNITQIYEYTPYSTRGGKSITENTTSASNPSSSAYYEYHTNWSFSPGEVLTFIVPSFYGFGNSIYDGPLTNGQEVDVNTYFGQMTFVDVAMYMGILVFFLALFAIYTRWKEPFVQFLAILTGIALLISFGRNFPVIFDLMFYYFPFFDKFRVPSMILVLVQLSTPLLAGLGLMKIIAAREENDSRIFKIIKNSAYVFTGIFVLTVLLNNPISSWFVSRVNDYANTLSGSQTRLAQQYRALADYSAGMFTTDLMLGFGFMTLAAWFAFGYVRAKLSRDAFILGIIILTLADLWRIDERGAQPKYVANPDVKSMFTEPEYIKVIKAQNDKEPFRMLNLKQDGSLGSFSNNANFNAYFLVEDFYGYSGIKPRGYQDIMDVVGPANATLWRMLNVKYLVFNQPVQIPGLVAIDQKAKEVVYKDTSALPRLYFVNSTEVKPDIEVLNMIKNNGFDPKDVAFVEDKDIHVEKPGPGVNVSITEYRDQTIKANVTATGSNFLFLGDTYLPKGWKAYIDGNSTKVYKANHDFMGIVVPKGRHTVEFKYSPTSFYISQYTALILSSLVILGLVISLLFEFKKKKNINVQTV